MANDTRLTTAVERLVEAVNKLDKSVEVLTSTVDGLKKTVDDHEERLRIVEAANTTLKERMTNWQFIQATYTTVMTTAAAIMGAVFGKR